MEKQHGQLRETHHSSLSHRSKCHCLVKKPSVEPSKYSADMEDDESFAELSFETEQQDETTVGTVEQASSNQTEAESSSKSTEALIN